MSFDLKEDMEKVLRDALAETLRAIARLELALRGMSDVDPQLVTKIRKDLFETLRVDVAAPPQPALGGRQGLSLVRGGDAPEKLPEIEQQIIDMVGESDDGGMRLDDIYAHLGDMGVTITKGALQVRLHRMKEARRLHSPTRAVYTLHPDLQAARR